MKSSLNMYVVHSETLEICLNKNKMLKNLTINFDKKKKKKKL